MSERFDVVVAGGGLVGASLALALGRAGVPTALVDSEPAPGALDRSAWDARIYAISPASIAFLTELTAWPRIEASRIAPCTRMEIFGDRPASRLEFRAFDVGAPILASIVESREIANALLNALREQPRVTMLAPARVVGLERVADAAIATLDTGTQLAASLVVGADGPLSRVRALAGIGVERFDYGERGVVANFAVAESHRDCAYQWFRGDSVLALLPLPGRRVSMVWSAANSYAQHLLGLPGMELGRLVAEAAGWRLGAFELVTPAHAFPLSRLVVESLVAERIALVGDAAHVVHPLAGQGVNMGFGDAQVLARLIAGRDARDAPGDARLLRRYRRERAEPILAMRTLTHGLHQLFGLPGNVPARLRNAGLNLTQALPVVRSLLARQAIG